MACQQRADAPEYVFERSPNLNSRRYVTRNWHHLLTGSLSSLQATYTNLQHRILLIAQPISSFLPLRYSAANAFRVSISSTILIVLSIFRFAINASDLRFNEFITFSNGRSNSKMILKRLAQPVNNCHRSYFR